MQSQGQKCHADHREQRTQADDQDGDLPRLVCAEQRAAQALPHERRFAQPGQPLVGTPAGLPFGVTLVAPADTDAALAPFADAMHKAAGTGSGLQRDAILRDLPAAAPDGRITVAVVGAHLTGMPLNHQLTSRNARLLGEDRTTPDYRLYALAGTVPPKPGLVRASGFTGPGIIVELWSLDAAGFGSFVAEIPQPLGIGKLTLASGLTVSGFIAEPAALDAALDITGFGGWRAYIASLTQAA